MSHLGFGQGFIGLNKIVAYRPGEMAFETAAGFDERKDAKIWRPVVV